MTTNDSIAAINNLTKDCDRTKIEELVEQLKPYMKFITEGYEGEKNAHGQRHGKGKLTYADGDIYDGEFIEDKRHGKGKYTYADGDIYDGEWKEDKKHGKGKLTYASGNIYDCEWKEGNTHGKGKYTYADDDIYDGEWKEDKKHGKAINTTIDIINQTVGSINGSVSTLTARVNTLEQNAPDIAIKELNTTRKTMGHIE